MAYGNNVELTGNVTRDPELRFAQSGVAIVQFGVAWNRKVGEEDEAHFFDVVAFRELAENVAESIKKGMRIVVTGRLQHRTWETSEGDRRSKVEIVADEISPSLRWASAEVTRNQRNDGGGGGGRRGGGDPGPQPDGERAPARQGGGQRRSAPQNDDEPF